MMPGVCTRRQRPAPARPLALADTLNTLTSATLPAESGDLIAVPIAWAVAYRLPIKGVGGSSLVCERVSLRGRERWSSGSVGLAPGAAGPLGAVPGVRSGERSARGASAR